MAHPLPLPNYINCEKNNVAGIGKGDERGTIIKTCK